MRKSVIVGTAGHIDHGKTALVKALTGVETDRLAEEKRRGITIELGFAHWDASPELRLGFIDVPGHERFVRNMLAGASGVDLALLVIAADESVMPQTLEHLAICRLLGIERYVVALTKSDIANPDTLEVARIEAEELFEKDARPPAIVTVSAHTGDGLDELRAALVESAESAREKDSGGLFRLPVDRVFVKKGFGAVVTGTLIAGSVAVGDEVEIHPSGVRARVRGLQVHGEAREEAHAGERSAVNLAGVDAAALSRGMLLAQAGAFNAVQRADCRLQLLPGAPALEHEAPLHLHLGSAETTGRVLILERDPASGRRLKRLAPGRESFVRLEWQDPLVAVRGDRFVIRRFSPVTTIGGGVILDNQSPVREPWEAHRERLLAFLGDDLAEALARAVQSARYGVSLERLVARLGRPESEIRTATEGLRVVADRVVAPERWERLRKTLLDRLAAFHREQPLDPGAPKGQMRTGPFPGAPTGLADALITELVEEGKVVLDGELMRLASHRLAHSREEAAARDKLLEAYEASGLEAPRLEALLPELPVDAARARRLLRNLVREGKLAEVTQDLVVSASALDRLRALLAERKKTNPWLSVADLKSLAGLSRKYAIPLLEYLDQQRITRREGDKRRIL